MQREEHEPCEKSFFASWHAEVAIEECYVQPFPGIQTQQINEEES